MTTTTAPKIPPFLEQARLFYGPAFDHPNKKALAAAMAEWSEMDETERSFADAHLAYLHLEAQAATLRATLQVRDLLEEIAEVFTAAVEMTVAEEPTEEVAPAPEKQPDTPVASVEEVAT